MFISLKQKIFINHLTIKAIIMKKLAIKFLCLIFVGLCFFACKTKESVFDKFLTEDEIMTKIYFQNISLNGQQGLVNILAQNAHGEIFIMDSEPFLTELELLEYDSKGNITKTSKAYHIQFFFVSEYGGGRRLGYLLFPEREYEKYENILQQKKGLRFRGVTDNSRYETETRFTVLMGAEGVINIR